MIIAGYNQWLTLVTSARHASQNTRTCLATTRHIQDANCDLLPPHIYGLTLHFTQDCFIFKSPLSRIFFSCYTLLCYFFVTFCNQILPQISNWKISLLAGIIFLKVNTRVGSLFCVLRPTVSWQHYYITLACSMLMRVPQEVVVGFTFIPCISQVIVVNITW